MHNQWQSECNWIKNSDDEKDSRENYEQNIDNQEIYNEEQAKARIEELKNMYRPSKLQEKKQT